MWDKTNYSAQVAQLKQAGLNPGLLYGMGGAGGATTGPGGMPMPTTAQAEGGSALAAAGSHFDILTKRAQLDLMEAQADNLRADSENKRDVDRKKKEAETQNLLQEYDNLREDWEYKRALTTYQKLLNWQLEATNEDRIDEIKYNARSAGEALKKLEMENKIKSVTLKAEISKVQHEVKALLAEAVKRGLKVTDLKGLKEELQVNNANYQGQEPKGVA